MVGIGKAGSSFGGVSGKAKGSGVVISQDVRDAAADVVADSSDTLWYVTLSSDFCCLDTEEPPIADTPIMDTPNIKNTILSLYISLIGFSIVSFICHVHYPEVLLYIKRRHTGM